MSYSVNTSCWNCELKNNPCTDEEKIQAGVNALYQDTGKHKGAGSILLSCGNRVPKGTAAKEEIAKAACGFVDHDRQGISNDDDFVALSSVVDSLRKL